MRRTRSSISARSGLGIGEQARGRGDIFIFGQLVERRVAPTLAAELGQGNADGDLVNPGGELAAALEGVELVEDAQQRLLGYFLHQGLELGLVGGEPAGEGVRQAFFDDPA
jgi:hypothetical protein